MNEGKFEMVLRVLMPQLVFDELERTRAQLAERDAEIKNLKSLYQASNKKAAASLTRQTEALTKAIDFLSGPACDCDTNTCEYCLPFRAQTVLRAINTALTKDPK